LISSRYEAKSTLGNSPWLRTKNKFVGVTYDWGNNLGGGPALKGFNCLTTRSGCLSKNDLLILPHLLVYSAPES